MENYNQSIVGALKDVSDQVIRIRSLTTQAQDAERSVAAARKNYELAREGYRRGLTDYLNVLTAQNQLLRAQEGVAKVHAERLGAHASLVTALGGGLDEPANGPAANETLPGHGKGKGARRGQCRAIPLPPRTEPLRREAAGPAPRAQQQAPRPTPQPTKEARHVSLPRSPLARFRHSPLGRAPPPTGRAPTASRGSISSRALACVLPRARHRDEARPAGSRAPR